MEKLEASTLANFIAAMYPHLGRVFVLEENDIAQSAVLYSSTGKQKKISIVAVMSAQGDARRLSRRAVAEASKAVPIGTFGVEQNGDIVVFMYTREIHPMFGYRNRETNLVRLLTSSDTSLSMCVGDFVWSKIKENRLMKKAVFIDEAWQLIGSQSNEMAAEYEIDKKRSAKKNV